MDVQHCAVSCFFPLSVSGSVLYDIFYGKFSSICRQMMLNHVFRTPPFFVAVTPAVTRLEVGLPQFGYSLPMVDAFINQHKALS